MRRNNRRSLVQWECAWAIRCAAVGAMSALSLAGCADQSSSRDAAVFRSPGEFEPQEAVWLSPEPDDPEFMNVTAEMVDALLPHVRVRMIVSNEASLDATREQLSRAGVDVGAIEFTVDPLATYFIRDGANYMVNGRGALAVLDLKWSLYGLPGWGVHLYPDDPHQAARIATFVNQEQDAFEHSFARASNASVITSPLFLENACFEVNGQGVLLISEPLALERNLGRSRADLETDLLRIPGIRKVIWLGKGLAQDPLEVSTIEGGYVGMGAGGHTDEFVRFVDARTIMLAWADEDRVADHPLNRINRERMQKNYDILSHSTDQDGQPFRIIRIPMPNVVERPIVLPAMGDGGDPWNVGNFPASEGRRAGDEVIQVAAASYLNFVIANDLVLVPSYVEDGTPAEVQDRVRFAFATALPGRTIRFIHATPLNWNGGGPHCATLSEPKRQ